jgi:diguanylate cyclase (GGDEF)-like protein
MNALATPEDTFEEIGSPIYRIAIRYGLWAVVLAWTLIAIALSLIVTSAIVIAIWGGIGWIDLGMSALITAIVTPPISYHVGGLMQELNRSRLSLRRLAQIDALTGIANRGYFLQHAEFLLRIDPAPVSPIAALMIDIDHFKDINDRSGHAAGDAVISAVAEILQHNIRGSDLLGRYGGEEFAVLLPNTNRETAISIADRMRVAISENPKLQFLAGRAVTVSIGVTETSHAPVLDRLLLAADHALYKAKAAGRNRTNLTEFDVNSQLTTEPRAAVA